MPPLIDVLLDTTLLADDTVSNQVFKNLYVLQNDNFFYLAYVHPSFQVSSIPDKAD